MIQLLYSSYSVHIFSVEAQIKEKLHLLTRNKFLIFYSLKQIRFFLSLTERLQVIMKNEEVELEKNIQTNKKFIQPN